MQLGWRGAAGRQLGGSDSLTHGPASLMAQQASRPGLGPARLTHGPASLMARPGPSKAHSWLSMVADQQGSLMAQHGCGPARLTHGPAWLRTSKAHSWPSMVADQQ